MHAKQMLFTSSKRCGRRLRRCPGGCEKEQIDRKQARRRDGSCELDWRLEADLQMRDTFLAGLIQTAQPQLLYRSGSRGLNTGRAGGYASRAYPHGELDLLFMMLVVTPAI